MRFWAIHFPIHILVDRYVPYRFVIAILGTIISRPSGAGLIGAIMNAAITGSLAKRFDAIIIGTGAMCTFIRRCEYHRSSLPR